MHEGLLACTWKEGSVVWLALWGFSFSLLVYHGRGMEMVFGLLSPGIRASDRDLHIMAG